jgi:hypothetical protein
MLLPSTATVNSNLGIVVEERVKCEELKETTAKEEFGGGGSLEISGHISGLLEKAP